MARVEARLRHLGTSLLLLAALVLAPAAVRAAPVQTEHVEAELVPESPTIAPGRSFTIATRLKVQPGWHVYWINPGEAGLPPTVDWTLPKGFAAGPIAWPYPKRLPIPGAMNYGYEGELLLLSAVQAPATVPSGVLPISAKVQWIVCAEVCVPGEATVATSVRAGAPAPDPRWTAAFAATRAALPRAPAGWSFSAEQTADSYRLIARPPAGASVRTADLFFFSQDENVVDAGAAQPVTQTDGRIVATLKKAPYAEGKPTRLRGIWVAQGGWSPGLIGAAVDTPIVAGAASPSAPAPDPSATGLIGTALLALLGGLVLNLMPCVFPVIGLKILGFAQAAGQDRRKVIAHGLTFAAGVLISFWILAGLLAALRAGGDQLGWGFQLQSPAFVFALAAVMLVFALNLSGAFEFGVRATALGSDLQTKSGLLGTFFTGFLATVVATPCSAPFLAPALGAAVVLPPAQSFVVFTAIGIGLSAPYLLLSIFPQMVRFLPRPGAWMETFKQIMAFPLYATVAYLLWVLAGQVDDEGLLKSAWGLVAIAMAAWAYGRWTRPEAKPGRARLGYAAAIMLAGGGAWLGWPQSAMASEQTLAWDKWSPEAVAHLQGEGRTIYVDFTARWCATCQTNKALVFHSDAVLKKLADNKVALLRADWTNRDPAITAELAKWQRTAIPFNLVYKPGAAEPAVLPEVLTPDVVLKAIG